MNESSQDANPSYENKWQLLYEYSRKCLDEDIERFQLIDAKSAKFLTLVSTVFALISTVSAWAFKTMMPPASLLTWILFISITLTFVFMISSWSLLFRSIKLAKAPRMPLTDELINLFWNRKINTIYFALTKTCREALDENRKIIEIKGNLIEKAYLDIACSAWLVATDVVLIVVIKLIK